MGQQADTMEAIYEELKHLKKLLKKCTELSALVAGDLASIPITAAGCISTSAITNIGVACTVNAGTSPSWPGTSLPWAERSMPPERWRCIRLRSSTPASRTNRRTTSVPEFGSVPTQRAAHVLRNVQQVPEVPARLNCPRVAAFSNNG